MPSYTVRRDVETVATANAASDSVAKSAAVEQVREQLAASDALADFDAEAAEIFEFPSGPFDPHRVTVDLTVAVVVEAADESAAIEAGDAEIDALLGALDLDDIEYAGPARVDAAVS